MQSLRTRVTDNYWAARSGCQRYACGLFSMNRLPVTSPQLFTFSAVLLGACKGMTLASSVGSQRTAVYVVEYGGSCHGWIELSPTITPWSLMARGKASTTHAGGGTRTAPHAVHFTPTGTLSIMTKPTISPLLLILNAEPPQLPSRSSSTAPSSLVHLKGTAALPERLQEPTTIPKSLMSLSSTVSVSGISKATIPVFASQMKGRRF